MLVEIPGRWFSAKEKLSSLWHGFLQLANTKTTRPNICSATLLLNLPELLLTQKLESAASLLRRQIRELRVVFGPTLPFYLVISKCDLLPGFIEFFSEYTKEELSQAFGITLPTLSANDKLADIFCERFNALIKRFKPAIADPPAS